MLVNMVERKLIDVEGGPPVKQIREALKMTQLEFANLLGIYPHTVSRWENGKGDPKLSPRQFNALLDHLEPLGFTRKDLPDDLGQAG